ncbi:MAG: queuosine precursor transporter [Treponema sp.]|nr:queuosine precursor transporter [Treponema sp.]
MLKKTPLKYYCLDIVIAFFISVLITSNVASCAKIIDLRFSVFGIHLAFDGGTLLFPVAYIIDDLLTEVYGFKIARRVIWTGFIALAISALFFFLLGIMPGEQTWETYAGTQAYNAILGGMSTGGIVLASLSGYLAGNFFNSVILSKMKILTKGRFLWMRTIGSSVAGELIDSLVFISIASLAGVFPWELFVTLVLTNYLLKLSLEIICTPLSYLVIGFLKRAEGIDVYDHGVKYKVFEF